MPRTIAVQTFFSRCLVAAEVERTVAPTEVVGSGHACSTRVFPVNGFKYQAPRSGSQKYFNSQASRMKGPAFLL